MSNLTGAKNKEYIAILLEDYLENLSIEGANHLSEEALKSIEIALEEQDQKIKTVLETNNKKE